MGKRMGGVGRRVGGTAEQGGQVCVWVCVRGGEGGWEVEVICEGKPLCVLHAGTAAYYPHALW